VKAKRPILAGEEILLSYGEKSNTLLMVDYGFAVEENKYDYVRIANF